MLLSCHMKILTGILVIAAVLTFSAVAWGVGAPWENYEDGPQICIVLDPLAQEVSITRLGGGTRVVPYQIEATGIVFDEPVSYFVRRFTRERSTGHSLFRTCA